MSWTDQRVEALRKHWLEGWSASKIARELGAGITRNAVIGKVHRLGLSGRAKNNAGPAATRVEKDTSSRSRERTIFATRTTRGSALNSSSSGPIVRGNAALALDLTPLMVASPKIEAKTEAEVVIPISERVTIMELRDAMCRWPLGDPLQTDFRYCGARTSIGDGPYCRGHSNMAYQSIGERRRAHGTR